MNGVSSGSLDDTPTGINNRDNAKLDMDAALSTTPDDVQTNIDIVTSTGLSGDQVVMNILFALLERVS